MKKNLILFAVYSGIVVIQIVWFLSNSAELTTFVAGVLLGVGLTGTAVSAAKLLRPDKYRFIYESDEYEKS